jgi:Tir chaperone protein (CesT) family
MKASKQLDKVNDFLKQGGWGSLDGHNASLIQKGNASIAVVAVPEKDLLLVSSPVITLPEDNLLPLFRRLLTLNLTETQDAAFALNEEAGTIDLQIKRPLQGLDLGEFERAVNGLAAMADKYNDLLALKFGSDVVQSQAPKAGRWKDYISALNPLTTVVRQEDLKGRVRKIRAVFSVIGLGAAIGAAIFAFNRIGSWALAIFTFLWVQYIVVRIIPDLITDPDKVQRFIFFMLHPAVAVGLLYVTYGWWGKWWLSALIGYLGGTFLARLIGIIIMPRVAVEETRDDQERTKGWLGPQGRV